jgi:YegS/Rv2252/BmrU family lipid kinase
MPRRVKLIFNPIANLGRAVSIASALKSIAHDMEGVDWTGTDYPTHATELARQAAEDGYNLVVAMGGDGTMHEVLNGLMQVPESKRPQMGIVPVGSGNDFAYACGISALPEQALRQALSGKAKLVDVGIVRDASGKQEYWANAIGIGFDTIVTIKSRKVRFVQGFGVYLIAVLQTILFQYEPFKLKMLMDGQKVDSDLLLLVLMNGKREGGGFHVTPDSKPDDGVLDYLMVDHVNRLRMLRILPEVLKGSHEKMKDCHMGKFRTLELHSDRPLFVHADGEIYATPTSSCKFLSVEMIQNAIQVVR